MLVDAADDLVRDTGVNPREVRYLKDDLAGEIKELHRRYLAQRETLSTISEVCLAFADGRRPGRSVRA